MESNIEDKYNPKSLWDGYSKDWEKKHGDKNYLGDEWPDPGGKIKKNFIDPFLQKEKQMTSLEIGPGGGKWTEILLELSEKVYCVDISKEMLNRTQKRFSNINNLELVLIDGVTISKIPKNSINFFFTYDTFVHLEPRDIYNYLKQVYFLMKPGAVGIAHYSNVLSKQGWKKFEASIKPENLLNKRISSVFSIMTLEIMTKFLLELGYEILFSDSTHPRDLITAFRKISS